MDIRHGSPGNGNGFQPGLVGGGFWTWSLLSKNMHLLLFISYNWAALDANYD